MDVLTPNGLGATASNAAQATQDSTIGADFETFLVMLTAQMKNQDPLNPMDSQDFATQLATFSGVEQQVKTNDLLAAFTSQFATSNLGEMAGWVGMQARMAIPGDFDGTPIEIVPNPPVFADKVELVVWDSGGTERQRVTLPTGDDPFQWAGVDDAGQPFENGEYSFGIVSYSGGEVIDEATPEIFAEISEVRTINGQAIVALDSGALYPAGLVRGLR